MLRIDYHCIEQVPAYPDAVLIRQTIIFGYAPMDAGQRPAHPGNIVICRRYAPMDAGQRPAHPGNIVVCRRYVPTDAGQRPAHPGNMVICRQ